MFVLAVVLSVLFVLSVLSVSAFVQVAVFVAVLAMVRVVVQRQLLMIAHVHEGVNQARVRVTTGVERGQLVMARFSAAKTA